MIYLSDTSTFSKLAPISQILKYVSMILIFIFFGSAQHTRLLAASADLRLVCKYFSSTKEKARDATVGMYRMIRVRY